MKTDKENMKNSWDLRARENPYHWVDSTKNNWTKNEYYQKGEKEAVRLVISFLKEKGVNESDLKEMRCLDIGCGTGRFSAALAQHFKFVDGIDISTEMIKIAKRDHVNTENLQFQLGNGVDLRPFPKDFFDFAFSFLVFQHIPRKSIIINYLREIYRVLKPGGYMKIQVRGYPGYLPSGLAGWRYKGFDSFLVALSEIRRIQFFKIPFLKIKKYDTTFGAFFKKKELEKIVKKIGYSEVVVFYDAETPKYLWASAKK